MISIKGCERQREAMTRELRKNCDEFLNGGFVLDFEQEWFERLLSGRGTERNDVKC